MKTLKIDTGLGTVVLTYSEVAQKWDFFSSPQEALKQIDSMCTELGWVYDPKLRNFQPNFVAENADKFVVDAKEEKSIDQLWDVVEIDNSVEGVEKAKGDDKKYIVEHNSTLYAVTDIDEATLAYIYKEEGLYEFNPFALLEDEKHTSCPINEAISWFELEEEEMR